MPNLTTPNKNYLFEKFYGTRKIKEICPIFTCKNKIYKSSFSTLLYDKNSEPSILENYRPVCQYCKNRAYRKNFSFTELNNETNNIKSYVTYFSKNLQDDMKMEIDYEYMLSVGMCIKNL